MTGPVEEVGSTTRSLITALSGNPTQLGMLVLIFGLLLFFFYAQREAARFRETMMTQVLENSKTIHSILLERAVTCPSTHGELEPLKPLEQIAVEPLKPIGEAEESHKEP